MFKAPPATPAVNGTRSVKDWDTIPHRVALAFPDIYDLGMSNLGLAILYDLINKLAGHAG